MLSKKNRIVASLVSLGSVLALAGAGYAAWVIAGSDQTDNSQGATVEAYAVTDKRIALSVAAKDDSNTIVFGKPKDATNYEGAWLIAENDVSAEDLDFHFVATVDNAAYCSGVTASIAIAEANKTDWEAVVTADYVTAPTEVIVEKKTEGENGSATYDISGSFAWGTHFGKRNPYTYYNSQGANETLDSSTTTYADDAKKALTALYKLNGAKFVLTVKATFDTSK
jgi:hypothetical protein